LELTEAIQEITQRKACLTSVRDPSWETTAELAFGFPITIDTEIQRIEAGAVIPCCAHFQEEVPKSPKAPASRVEEMMSVRWGVQVQFAPNQSLILAPSKRFEFVSVIRGQRASMTETRRRHLESELEPKEIRLAFTVCDGFSRYPVDLVAKPKAAWGQVMEA
jgi:hypothetical protein